MAVRVIHGRFDTQPRVTAGPGAATVELLVPFRIEADPAERIVSWRLDVTVDGELRPDTPARRITPELVEELRDRLAGPGRFAFDEVPPYLDMADRMGPGVAYLEGRVGGLADGAAVTYALEVTTRRDRDDPVESRSDTCTTYAVRPDFGRGDVIATHIPGPFRAMEAWVLHHRRGAELDVFRVDVAALEDDPWNPRPELLDLVIRVGAETFDVRDPDPARLPLACTAADSVTIAVPHTGGPVPAVAVTCRGAGPTVVDPAAPPPTGATRVMFVNFAIQGLNDYFATADTDYTPPRTYAQVTMRDEGASFSSRPGSREDHTGDGYEFTLAAHRHHGIPQLWAMNGGLLDLLAHDCPADLDRMREDVDARLMVPVVAGFGAHRLPYYRTGTNLDAITWGTAAMDAMLGSHGPVYYPDSRIVTDRPNVADALVGAGVEYLVVDAGEEVDDLGRPTTRVENAAPALNAETAGRWVNRQYLWRDRTTGIKILFIDPEMKDGLFGASDAEAARGKVSLSMRRKFIELATQPVLRRGNLLVYSDDADKASGNGWFDGVYGGAAVQYNKRYQAALSWIRAHPWVHAVTTDDLDDTDVIGDLDLVSATDPYINLHWRLPGMACDPDHGMAFDTWFTAWRQVPAAWLGETLGAISDRAERAVAGRPASNELDELARMYLTMCLHESQWSKRARQGHGDDPALFTGPEDFVITETLQMRNTHVYLYAAAWADWAAGEPPERAYRDSGPVIEQVAALATPAPWRVPGRDGLQWDHDPLPNVILHNTRVLVVIDLNGGRITHLFAMVDGRPCSLSGTFKAYQFLDVDWTADAGVKCDGIVAQNTVWTPNHAYAACDADAAQGTVGAAAPDDPIFDWYYPDNFNAYRVVGGDDTSVTLAYENGAPLDRTPATLEQLDHLLAEDRTSRVAGGPGVVLHDEARFGRFRKTIRLDGAVVRVSYTDTRPGHVVANEFCVDLWAAAVRGQRQAPSVAGRTARVTNDAGPSVAVELGAGCDFSAATLLPPDPPTVESLRLHRVMTDNVEVVGRGGAFDYAIVLP
jgi:hypothetical protein